MAAGEPVGEVGIGEFQDGFEVVEFGVGHGGDSGGDEVADEEVVFVGAAVLGAKNQPAAAVVQRNRVGVRRRLGHLGCDIAAVCTSVSM